MQYYPSGLPWNTNLSPSYQPYKYSGKEFIEMHGLDEYDSEARWYYPAIMRTTSMDPMCEKYYSTSPYAWCGNNPVNYVDPDGRDTLELGSNGLVLNYIESKRGNDIILLRKQNSEIVGDPLELPLGTMKKEFDYMAPNKENDGEHHMFAISVQGNEMGERIFEYIVNSMSGTYEWGLVQVEDNMTGKNYISTSSLQGKISSNSVVLHQNRGMNIYRVIHSHPTSNQISKADNSVGHSWIEQNLVSEKTLFYIYYVPTSQYIRYVPTLPEK